MKKRERDPHTSRVACLRRSPLQLSDKHFLSAVGLLRLYDHVFISENFSAVDACRLRALGWRYLGRQEHAAPLAGTSNSREASSSLGSDPTVLDALLSATQRWDVRLY